MSLTPHFPALFSSWLPTIIHCSADYGRNIQPSACTNLFRAHWPDGPEPIRLYNRDPVPRDALRLPYTVTEAGCTLSIEAAGPGASRTHYVTVYPDMLVTRAEAVIQQCPGEGNGIGGFVTHGFRHALSEFFAPWGWGEGFSGQDVLERRLLSGFFLSISVYGGNDYVSRPGDTDPMIGGAVARMAALRWREWDNQNLGRILMRHLMNFFRSRAIDMRRRGALTWWEGVLDHRIRGSGPWTESERNGTANSGTTTTADLERTMAAGSETPTMTDSAKHSNATSVPDNESQDPTDPQEHGDMTYQCDSTLGGAPAPIDCEKLSWSGLKPPDSVETLQAHIPNTYSQGTCALGISSTTTTTITWAHLLAAFDTLFNLCVRNPINSAKGGRAYYGQQVPSSWINGKRDSVAGVSGGEALPVGINATLFKHDARSNLSCEVALAMQGKAVRMCEVE